MSQLTAVNMDYGSVIYVMGSSVDDFKNIVRIVLLKTPKFNSLNMCFHCLNSQTVGAEAAEGGKKGSKTEFSTSLIHHL